MGFAAYDDNGHMRGFLVGHLVPWLHYGNECLIDELCVAPAYQEQGVGTAILTHLHQYLITIGVLSVMLFTKKQAPAYNFYRRHGYLSDADMVFMAKHLK